MGNRRLSTSFSEPPWKSSTTRFFCCEVDEEKCRATRPNDLTGHQDDFLDEFFVRVSLEDLTGNGRIGQQGHHGVLERAGVSRVFTHVIYGPRIAVPSAGQRSHCQRSALF